MHTLRTLPRLRWGLLGAAAALLPGCAVLKIATAGRSHPQTMGSLTATGLSAPVDIHRDARGIPHIRAQSTADAIHALGFVHGQDRLFQMDLRRRLIEGRGAAWLGPDVVDFDTFAASLEVERRSRQALEAMSPQTQELLAAYAQGINDAVATSRALPIEYRVLGLEWEPWRAEDSVAMTYLFSFALGLNPATQIVGYELRDRLDREDMQALYGLDPGMPPVEAWWPEVQAAETSPYTSPFASFLSLVWHVHTPEASNAFAVTGTRSADGSPILANDTHQVATSPGPWYIAELRGADLQAAGATVPGLPFFIAGHNGRVAWGLTDAMQDNADLALVPFDGEGAVLLDGVSHPIEYRPVSIEVAGQDDPVSVDVPWTALGPVVSELAGTHVVVFQWLGFDVVDHGIEAGLGLLGAASVDEALTALEFPTTVPLRAVVADVDGTVATAITGTPPRREGFSGWLPWPATDGRGWTGVHAPPPVEIIAEGDVAVAANARPTYLPTEQVQAISARWARPWRESRVRELLSERTLHDPDSLAAIQLDRLDVHARAHLPRLLEGTVPQTPAAERCAALLRDWDFVSSGEAVAPTVWEVLQRELAAEVLADELGDAGLGTYLPSALGGGSVLDGDVDHFTDDLPGDVALALDRTCTLLSETLGDDVSDWQWGPLHSIWFAHPFSLGDRGVALFSPRPVPWGGSENTVNAGGSMWGWPEPRYEAQWVPVMRIVLPLGDLEATRIVNVPGQSGHLGHDNRDDQLEPWRAGEMLPLRTEDDAVLADTVSSLRLLPQVPR